jgi:hypothetical protein
MIGPPDLLPWRAFSFFGASTPNAAALKFACCARPRIARPGGLAYLWRCKGRISVMIRLVFRVLAMATLAVAVVLAVVDATRSVLADEIVLTPLGQTWYALSPDTLGLAQAAVQRHLHPAIWDPGAIWVLTMPGFAVTGVLALLFYAIGRRPARPAGRFTARA